MVVSADQGGLQRPVRLKTNVCLQIKVLNNSSAEAQSNNGTLISEIVDIHSLLSNVLEQTVARVPGASFQIADPSQQLLPIIVVELISSIEPWVRSPVEPTATMRVGLLELDLINRTARRGDRSFDLQSREFRLLKYMMQRCGQLVTRAKLLEDVWNYKFIPKTNLVDVHLGRLRRKVDASHDTPMIRNVRGVGFVLYATE